MRQKNILTIGYSSPSVEDVVHALRDVSAIQFDFCHVPGLNDARQVLQDNHWDLILYDATAPDLHPFEIIHLTQTLQPQAPLIVQSLRVTARDAVDMMRRGARGLVEKNDHARLIELIIEEFEGDSRPGRSSGGETRPSTLPDTRQVVQESLKRVLDNLREAIWSLTLPERQLIYVSPSFESVIGYPLQNFLNDQEFFREIVHPNDLEEALAAMQTGLRDGFAELECRIILPDGQLRWLHRRASVIFDEQRRPIQVNECARDITALKQAEAALRASEEKYRSLAESSDALITTVNQDGRFLYFNAIGANAFGVTAESLIGKTIYDLLPPDQADRIVRVVRDVIATNNGKVIEPDITVAGKSLWVRLSIQPIRDNAGAAEAVLIHATEVTDRKHAEREIRAQNEMLHQSRDLFALGNLQSEIIFMNQGGAAMLGSDDPEIFVGKPIPYFHIPEDAERIVTEALPHALKTGYWQGENRLKTLDGRLIDVDQTIFPIRDSSGEIVQVATIMVEITERKRAEAARAQSERLLRLFIEYAPAAIAMLDKNMIYLATSRRWLTDYRIREESVIGRSHYEVFPEIPERLREINQRCLKGAVEKHDAEPFWRADGSVDWVHWEVHPWYDDKDEIGGILIFSEVVTERIQAEETLRQSEKRYRQMFEMHGLPKLIIDPQNGRIVDANPAAGQFYGYAVDTLKTLTLFDINPLSPPEIQTKMAQAASATITSLDTVHIAAGNRLRNVEVFTRPIENDGKQLLYSIVTDITEKKQAQAALQEAKDQLEQRVIGRTEELTKIKDRLEAIFNHSGDGIMLLHIEDGLQQTNDAFDRTFGVDKDWSQGAKLSSFFEADQAETIEAAVRAVAETRQTRHIEARARRGDGTILEVEISIAPVNRSSTTADSLVCIIRDITARKEQERRLRYHASVQASMSDAVIVTDMDLHIQSWNKAAERIYGWTEAEVLGRMGSDILRTEFASPEEYLLALEKVRSEYWWQAEVVQRRKDDSRIDISSSVTLVRDEDGQPLGLVGVNHEITERKQAEMALRESEARYRLLAENIKDVIVQTAPDGTCIFITPSCFDLFGYQPEELIGRSGYMMIHPDDWDKSRTTVVQAIEANADSYIIERRSVHKDGHAIWVEVHGTIIRDPASGKPTLFISVIRDIGERKQAEAALQRYAADIEDLYNNAPTGYHSLDKDGIFVQINDTELDWLGYSRDEVVGKLKFTEILTDSSMDTFRQNFRAFMESGRVNDLEFEMRRKDGSTFTTVVNATAIYDENGQFVRSRSTLVDITEIKKAQDALKASEQRYRTLINTMSEGISLQGQDGAVQTCNPAAERILGLSQDEIIGRSSTNPHWKIVHEDGTPFPGKTTPPMVTLATGEPQSNVIMGIYKPDGSLSWILVNTQPLFEAGQSRPYAVVSTFTDITARKEAETKLNIQSQRLRLATETGGIGVWDWDIQNDHLIWDAQMFVLYGMTPEQFDGRIETTWNSGLLFPQDIERMQSEVQSALAGETPLDSEFRIRRPDGEVRYLKVKAVVFRDAANTPIRMIGVNWDITLLKQAEESLHQSLEKEMEIGEVKSRFIYTASHEFRTPLAAILATTESLTHYRQRMDDSQIDARLNRIRLQVNHMKSIMEDVLQVSRLQAGHLDYNPAPGDLDLLCQKTVEEFEDQIEYKGRLVYDCATAPVRTRFDARLMQRVIGNLIHNALKYSTADKSVLVVLSQDADQIVLRVKDEGIGIPAADIPRLFEPFHRAKNVGSIQGTGLGLSIVKQAVELHDGKITVESEEGLGTIFTLVIPNLTD